MLLLKKTEFGICSKILYLNEMHNDLICDFSKYPCYKQKYNQNMVQNNVPGLYDVLFSKVRFTTKTFAEKLQYKQQEAQEGLYTLYWFKLKIGCKYSVIYPDCLSC